MQHAEGELEGDGKGGDDAADQEAIQQGLEKKIQGGIRFSSGNGKVDILASPDGRSGTVHHFYSYAQPVPHPSADAGGKTARICPAPYFQAGSG
ncbi:hypothetical protein MPLB_2300031 [Mesorhizobium sp. ORS 3324]|nr:hypothetical protein MPLB_2300031 [Mesorhizobium sp. ORS 3324]